MTEKKRSITEVTFELTSQELKNAVVDFLEDEGKFTSGDEVKIIVSSTGTVSLVCEYHSKEENIDA